MKELFMQVDLTLTNPPFDYANQKIYIVVKPEGGGIVQWVEQEGKKGLVFALDQSFLKARIYRPDCVIVELTEKQFGEVLDDQRQTDATGIWQVTDTYMVHHVFVGQG
jgi:hypothetical protein